MTRATPFMMFEGRAEEALSFYAETIPDSRIVSIDRWSADSPGEEGKVFRAHAVIAGQPVMAHDSYVAHDFTFTPSISFYVECADEVEIERLAAALSKDGSELMPLGGYGWSRRFGWFSDRFGISWQLNLQ